MITVTFSIYTLAYSNGAVFYVGSTRQLVKQRISTHISMAKRPIAYGCKEKAIIIRSMNYDPIINTVESFTHSVDTWLGIESVGLDLERKWIIKLISEGHPLINKRMTA